jgi:hypothetical protein
LGVAQHERRAASSIVQRIPFHYGDADVWVATSAEGRITTEAPSRDALVERLKAIVPDVLESRLGHAPGDVAITINWQELRTLEQTELMVA